MQVLIRIRIWLGRAFGFIPPQVYGGLIVLCGIIMIGNYFPVITISVLATSAVGFFGFHMVKPSEPKNSSKEVAVAAVAPTPAPVRHEPKIEDIAAAVAAAAAASTMEKVFEYARRSKAEQKRNTFAAHDHDDRFV